MLRLVVVLAVAVLAVALGAAGAVAGGGGKTVEDFPLEFTLSSPPCDQLPPGTIVTGTGTITIRTWVQTDEAGVTHVLSKEVAGGTASDTAGGTYHFNYKLVFGADFTGFPFTADVKDFFHLVNDQTGANVSATFTAKITFLSEDPEDVVVEFIKVTGDPEHCDPI
jgi:hypothetical protein